MTCDIDVCPGSGGDAQRGTNTTMTMYKDSSRAVTQSKLLHHHRGGHQRQRSSGSNSCNTTVNPYVVLELRRDATSSEIRSAYKRLALLYHPGRRRTIDESSSTGTSSYDEMFEIVSACYETLASTESRRRYDNQLKMEAEKLRNQLAKKVKKNKTFPTSKKSKALLNMDSTATRKNRMTIMSTAATSALVENNSDDVSHLGDGTMEDVSDHEDTATSTATSSTSVRIWGDTASKRPMRQLYQKRRRINQKRMKKDQTSKSRWPSTTISDEKSVQSKNTVNSQVGDGDDTLPPLALSSSSRSLSDDDSHPIENILPHMVEDETLTPYCSNLGSSLVFCYHPDMGPSHSSSDSSFLARKRVNPRKTHERALVATSKKLSSMNRVDRDSTDKYGRALVDASSSESHPSSGDEATERHFSEAVVDRLFGGPLAPLHKARNFSAFTDPYAVFESVFGSKLFPKPTSTSCGSAHHQTHLVKGDNEFLIRSHPSNAYYNERTESQMNGWATTNKKSHIVGSRVITRTETLRTSPFTGRKTLSIVVQGHEVDPSTAQDKSDSSSFSFLECLLSLCNIDFDWCQGSTRDGTKPIAHNDSTPNTNETPTTNDKKSLNSLTMMLHSTETYGQSSLDAMIKDIHQCHKNMYTTCEEYMSCSKSTTA